MTKTKKKEEGRDDNAVSERCFVAHIPKARSNSSNRIRAASEAFLTDPFNNNKKIRFNKKKEKMDRSLEEVKANDKCKIGSDVLRDHIVFADGGKKGESTIQLVDLEGSNRKRLKILRVSSGDLHVPKIKLNRNKGLTTTLENGKPAYILCPRAQSLKVTQFNKYDAAELIDAYEGAIEASNNTIRGGNIKIESDCGSKYVCVGSAAKRGGKGIREIHHGMKKLAVEKQRMIHRHMRQIEELFRQNMPTDATRQVMRAITLVNAPLFSTTDGKTSDIYQAFAIGKNVFLSAHVDKDFTYSAVTVLVRGRYTVYDGIIAYFNFPRLGLAIPLRPGDVLFFDPKETHMISSRCNKDDDIYCLSFYLKSNIIGGNDNDKPLNDEEKHCLQHHLERVITN